MYSTLLTVAAVLPSLAFAQVYTVNGSVYTVTQDTGEDVPLASKHFNYPYLPYKADSGDGPRGIMTGYNICNSSTLGPESMCATAFINSIDDFCIWGAPGTDQIVADVEGEMVAYCTTSKYGTRVLPTGALQGVQFIKTPGYVEVVGFIDQTALNLNATDYGGEEDPHGADQRGNPLGSLLYSSAFGAGPSSAYKQVIEWSYFVGSGTFCFKACDPAGPNAAQLCNHVYDRIGCAYNAPANYAAINGTFQSCAGDNQLPVGVYVTNGRTSTWYQPPESLGEITTIPYTPAIPATSQCTPYTSSNLFTQLTTLSSSSAVSSAPSVSSIPTASGAAVTQAANKNSSSGATSLVAFSAAALLTLAGSAMLLL